MNSFESNSQTLISAVCAFVHHQAPNGVRRYDPERDNHKQSFLSIVTDDIIKALFDCSGGLGPLSFLGGRQNQYFIFKKNGPHRFNWGVEQILD